MNTKKTIKDKIKEFFSNPKDVVSFFLPIVIAIILIIPVPYYVTVGGGTLEIDEKIEIFGEYESQGSFSSAYVKEMNGTVITYLMAKIIPSYELTKVEDVTLENEAKEDYDFREKLYFTSSLDTATKVAFNYLGKEIKIKEEKIYVTYIDKDAVTNLKTKDQVLAVNGQKVTGVNDIERMLDGALENEEVKITVLRDNKEIDTITKMIMLDGEKKLGIYLITEYEYETDPLVNFHFSNKEAGPSGGLMLSLSIYNKLTKEDITRGQKIVGTGTIDEDGNVGEIGGVKYKLKGAVKAKADIFIVPLANYEEAMGLAKEKNYDITIIPVETFDEAIKALEKLEVKND